jgi:hypothetical protein
VRIEGDLSAVARIAELFDLEPATAVRDSTEQPAISAVDASDANNQGATK